MKKRILPSSRFSPVRWVYLGYYLKQLDFDEFRHLIRSVSRKSNWFLVRVLYYSLRDSVVYNISPTEYVQFGFPEKSSDIKRTWAGTGYMYEYQRLMNPIEFRNVLDDKWAFYKAYGKFFRHKVFSLAELEAAPEAFHCLVSNWAGKIVVKASRGKCGKQVRILEASDYSRSSLIKLMRSEGFEIAEQFIQQHPEMNRLSPSAVNTVRIFTQLNSKNEVEILGCRLRISVNSHVDNMAAGNLAAPIDKESGIVSGPGVYSDIRKPDEAVHPVTRSNIVGFQVPFWCQCLELAERAALHDMRNRSIGWDIVVTEEGPSLIEGNHDWCKLVWQLPVRKGLKPILERHWREYVSEVLQVRFQN